jgi:hypothetical protein
MRNLVKSLLQTGLYFLEQPDHAVDVVRERIKEDVGRVRQGIRREDHTVRYVLTFAARVGVGLGLGILTAPARGDESRGTVARKAKRASEIVKPYISPEGNLAAGT